MDKKIKDHKKGVENDMDDDLGDLDLDGMDFGEMEDIDGNSRTPSTAGIAKELGKDATKGFLDGLMKQTAKKALPDEYSAHYGEAMDYVDFTKNIVQDSKSQVDKSLYKLGKEVKKALPFQLKMLDKYLENKESEFETRAVESEEAARDQGIASNLSSIFDKQLEVQKAIEAKRGATDDAEKRERITTNKLNLNVLNNIDANTANHTAFTLQIGKEYYRRSLELQFKSFFVQADLLKTTKDSFKAFSLQFDNIVKNTGLPDFVKLKTTERLSEVVRTQFMESAHKTLFSNNEYVKGVKERLAGLVKGKVDDVTGKIDGLTDNLGMLNSAGEMGGGSSGALIGGALAGTGGGVLGEWAGDKPGAKYKDKLAGNNAVQTGANYLQLLATSPSTFMRIMRDKIQGKKEEYEGADGPGGTVMRGIFGGLDELMGVTSVGKKTYEVKHESVLGHANPAIFDKKVHRSISEVIPMYLAKILKENSDLTKMYRVVNAGKVRKVGEVDELHYDYDGRELTTLDKLQKKVQEDVIDQGKKKDSIKSVARGMIQASVGELGKNKKENKQLITTLSSDKSSKMLEEYLSKASELKGTKFDYKTVIKDAADGNATGELKSLLDGNDALKKIIENLAKSKPEGNTEYLDSRMDDVNRDYPITAIREMFKQASLLAKDSTNNIPTDEALTVLAMMYTEYLTESGEDMTIKTIMSGRVYSYADDLTNNPHREGVEQAITSFAIDVKKIYNTSTMAVISAFEKYIGVVNYSLRANMEYNPAMFQTLNDYSAAVMAKGKLGKENLVEGKLGIVKDRVRMSMDDIRYLVRPSKEEAKEVKTNQTLNRLFDAFGGHKDRLTENLKAAGNNPLALGRALMTTMKEASRDIKNATKPYYDKIGKGLDDIKAAANDYSAEGITKFIDGVKKTSDGLKNTLEAEKLTKDKHLKELNNGLDKLKENINDPKAIRDMELEIARVTRMYDVSIRTLEKLANTMRDKADKLSRIPADQRSASDGLTAIRSELTSILDQVKTMVEENRNAAAPVTA